jgi:uncharacterized protein YceK
MHSFSLSLPLVALLLSGCAAVQTAPAAAPPPSGVPRFGTWRALSSAAAQRAAAAELDCPEESVALWQNDVLVRARGCQRLVYFEKAADKTWSRTGPRFELEPEDMQVDYDAAWPPLPTTGRTGFSLTVDEMRQLVRQHGPGPTYYARAECILRTDGTLRHCLVLGSAPLVSEAMGRWLQEQRIPPRTRDGVAVPSAYEETALMAFSRVR